jgi:D-serine deaminase-like pyridoxal phosphate-dependent protein
MRDLASKAGVAYRPHAKAHKTPVIAEMQLAAGAAGICCAKLGEAEVMAAAGIPDILITTEVVGRSKLMRLMTAAQQSRIAVVADDERNIADLAQAAQTAGIRLDVLVEVDVGQGRCGVPPGPEAARLAQAIAGERWLRFRGLQGYQGAIQMTGGYVDREAKVRASLAKLMESADLVRKSGLEIEVLTGGGTGTSIIDGALHGLTELQPGSYIFMDSKYRAIEWQGGAAQPFENALTILGSVISRPAPDRAIVDVGYKAASSDGGPIAPADLPGAAFAFAGDEHGQLKFEGRCPLAVGDKATFVPSHCDTTVNLYDRYVVTRGGFVEDVWDIAARGRVQ